jgi:hypothetical protein
MWADVIIDYLLCRTAAGGCGREAVAAHHCISVIWAVIIIDYLLGGAAHGGCGQAVGVHGVHLGGAGVVPRQRGRVHTMP